MGMKALRGKSPQMAHEELETFFIAYNLMRCLMAQAGVIHDVPLERLSFQGTADSVQQFSIAIAQARSKKKQQQLLAQLLEAVARRPMAARTPTASSYALGVCLNLRTRPKSSHSRI